MRLRRSTPRPAPELASGDQAIVAVWDVAGVAGPSAVIRAERASELVHGNEVRQVA